MMTHDELIWLIYVEFGAIEMTPGLLAELIQALHEREVDSAGGEDEFWRVLTD